MEQHVGKSMCNQRGLEQLPFRHQSSSDGRLDHEVTMCCVLTCYLNIPYLFSARLTESYILPAF